MNVKLSIVIKTSRCSNRQNCPWDKKTVSILVSFLPFLLFFSLYSALPPEGKLFEPLNLLFIGHPWAQRGAWHEVGFCQACVSGMAPPRPAQCPAVCSWLLEADARPTHQSVERAFLPVFAAHSTPWGKLFLSAWTPRTSSPTSHFAENTVCITSQYAFRFLFSLQG